MVWVCVFVGHLLFFDATWFSIDQTRDVLHATDIAAGVRFPLNGPMMHWIAHIGPLYYYVLAIPFLIYSHPYSAYVLLALLSTLTVVLGYRFAAKNFGPRCGMLFVVFYAPATFTVIDSRALWTPAFLPFWSVLALLAVTHLCWEKRDRGLVALAAVLGFATQFHLSFVLVLPVAAVAYLIYRPPIRLRIAFLSVAASLVTYAPYLVHQAKHEWADLRAFWAFAFSGKETASGPTLAFLDRVLNFLTYPAYLAEHWLHLQGIWLSAFQASCYLYSALLVTAVIWLSVRVVTSRQGDREETLRYATLLAWFGLIFLVLLLRRSDLYYYYFDLTLPLPALLVAVYLDRSVDKEFRWIRRRPVAVAGAALLSFYVLAQLGAVYFWLTTLDREGLMQLSVRQIDLHGFHSDVSRPEDTFITLRYKAEIARTLTEGFGWNRDEIYRNVFGSRFYDATDERGYFLHFFDRGSKNVGRDPVVLWHRSDPLETWAEVLQFQVRNVGPFRLGVVPRDATPLVWTMADGSRVQMPVRTQPLLEEYGFVDVQKWPEVPVVLTSRLALDAKPSLYLLVVIAKGTAVTPTLRVNSQHREPVATNRTQMTTEFFYTLEEVLGAGENELELALGPAAAFDLDIFGWARR